MTKSWREKGSLNPGRNNRYAYMSYVIEIGYGKCTISKGSFSKVVEGDVYDAKDEIDKLMSND